MNSANKSKTTVLYYDHTSNPMPLSHLYHATASRHLSSSISQNPSLSYNNQNDDFKTSSMTEIESAYCPQCLKFQTSDTAFSSSHGICCTNIDSMEKDDADRILSDQHEERKSLQSIVGCTSCPSCTSILSISIEPNYDNMIHNVEIPLLAVFKCPYCCWTSIESNLYEPVHKVAIEEMQNEQKRAIETLRIKLSKRIQDTQSKCNSTFQSLKTSWDAILQKEEKMRRHLLLVSSSYSSTPSSNHIPSSHVFRPAANTMIKSDTSNLSPDEERQRIMDHVYQSVLSDGSEGDIRCTWNRIHPNNTCEYETKENILHHSISWRSMYKQATLSPSPNDSITNLLPIPVSLRARAVRRCVVELEAGRPGILVKPKVNPLEGDSSLRFGHGQWWKKDSSAINIIPRIYVQNHVFDPSTDRHAILLRICNPTLGIVRLRICNNFIAQGNDEDKILQSLIIDSNTIETIDARLLEPNITSSSHTKMDLIVLEPIEDTFMDLGKGMSYSNPSGVDDWCHNALVDSESTSLTKLIGQDKDVAWVHYSFQCRNSSASSPDTIPYVATQLNLEIEVGNNSWESSLIKPLTNLDEERDFVSFQILPIWKVEV